MNGDVGFWVEAAVAALLVSSGLFVLVSAVGLLRLSEDFFVRMHPPALAYTFGNWGVTLAGILYFSAHEGCFAVYLGLIAVLLSMTVPVTTVLLARAVLFRRRAAGAPDTPPPLTPPNRA
ncbi:MAG: monovalent cation/H(+) antiporter subunit G [Gemmatimonadales bacterium]